MVHLGGFIMALLLLSVMVIERARFEKLVGRVSEQAKPFRLCLLAVALLLLFLLSFLSWVPACFFSPARQ
ncbi:hypothetical protein B0T21DRAFT_376237 [Apiosordaria backusii]|uniref:Uncharacterized protein n=1 Tax=Apiosordaria backusii TaxID=314023 RepID=A0AA40AAG5_9PEZI|nr:hypothetical protein B0T21DRAFT_376237 [Apiosordaria backusii]